jgi:DNA invertase Pin-like site-specific DNA recombinase
MSLLTLRNEINAGVSIYDLPLRVAYYARVSTDKEEQLNSLGNQTFYFEDFIKSNKNWKYIQGYIDEGLSGTTTAKRLGFLQMIKDGKAGKFDLIITKEISRFARDTLDSIRYTRELLDCGVGVFFQSDNINTLTPDAELRLTIMASLAQDESRKLSERLRFGYKRSIEQGRVLGQNNMLGYHKADGVLTVNEEQAVIVRRIFELYNEGKIGLRRIARQLESEGMLSPFTGKMLSPETIKSVITNPKYKGYYCSGKTYSIDYRNKKQIRKDSSEWNVYKDDRIPAIVSEEVWDRANVLYQERSRKCKEHGDAYQSRYSFSGKIFCGEHSVSYHRHVYKSKSKGEQEVWNCKLYRQKGKVDGCDSPTIYSTELFKILNDIYGTVSANKDEIIDGLIEVYSFVNKVNVDSREAKRLEKAVAKLKSKKDALLDLYMDKAITKLEFSERNDALNAEVEKLIEQLEALQEKERLFADEEQNMKKLKQALEGEFANESGFNAEMSNVLLDRIIVHKIDGSKHNLQLEIILNIGKSFTVGVGRDAPGTPHCISLNEIGISQAQVSRLEKGALNKIKRKI